MSKKLEDDLKQIKLKSSPASLDDKVLASLRQEQDLTLWTRIHKPLYVAAALVLAICTISLIVNELKAPGETIARLPHVAPLMEEEVVAEPEYNQCSVAENHYEFESQIMSYKDADGQEENARIQPTVKEYVVTTANNKKVRISSQQVVITTGVELP